MGADLRAIAETVVVYSGGLVVKVKRRRARVVQVTAAWSPRVVRIEASPKVHA